MKFQRLFILLLSGTVLTLYPVTMQIINQTGLDLYIYFNSDGEESIVGFEPWDPPKAFFSQYSGQTVPDGATAFCLDGYPAGCDTTMDFNPCADDVWTTCPESDTGWIPVIDGENYIVTKSDDGYSLLITQEP